jgi:hypothetical protein
MEIQTAVSIPNAEFQYSRRLEAGYGSKNAYDVIVPYAGEYTVDGRTVSVSSGDVERGRTFPFGDFDADGVGYWRFDEDGDVAYDWAGGRHLEGLSGMWTDGAVESGLQVPGDSTPLRIDSSSFGIGVEESLTVAFFLRGDLLETGGTFPNALFYQSSAGKYGLWARRKHPDFGIRFDDTTGTSVASFGIQTATFDNWHHVAACLDRPSSEVRLYFDGELVGRNANNLADFGGIESPGTLALGVEERFDVPLAFDELRLFKRALSDAEIQGLADGSRQLNDRA